MNSKNNHVVYSYDNVDWSPYNTGDFGVRFGQVEREPLSFREEACRTAEQIYKDTPDFCVGISGGIDSEIVARSFFECGYKFTPVIFQYKDKSNSSENDLAFSFLEHYGAKPEVITVDIFDYLNKQAFEICEEFNVPFRTLPYLYWLNTHTPAPLVSGSGLANLFQHPSIEDIMCFTVSNCINPYPQLASNGIESIPEFFFYTPEMMASVLLDPDVQRFAELGWTTANPGLDTWKMWFIPKYYKDDPNPVVIRKKKHGMEVVRAAGLMKPTGERLGYIKPDYQVCSWEYNDFLDSLLGKKQFDKPELIKGRIDFYA